MVLFSRVKRNLPGLNLTRDKHKPLLGKIMRDVLMGSVTQSPKQRLPVAPKNKSTTVGSIIPKFAPFSPVLNF